jgi:hypothetical protein
MKMVCYGVSFSAFSDYYQMGASTTKLCLTKLCQSIVKCPAISNYYLQRPTKSDAKKFINLHKSVHGIDGCRGSLEVTKIIGMHVRRLGKDEGKEGYPMQLQTTTYGFGTMLLVLGDC